MFYFVPSRTFLIIQNIGKYGAAALLVAGSLLWYFQTTLVYPAYVPKGSREDVWLPSKFGMDEYEEITLTTSDGERLQAYTILQGEATAKRPTVLILHANAGNMGHRLPIAKVFNKTLKMNVIMLSYRGYGKSTGKPSEKGIRKDAQTAFDWIVSHPRLEKTTKVVYGQSIGGAVAIDLASRNQNAIHGVVVENTFTSIDHLLPEVMPYLAVFGFLLTEHWNSNKLMSKFRLDMPFLFLSGSQDELVPPFHMEHLYKECSSKIKVLQEFPEGTHNDTILQPGYFERVAHFLRSYVLTEEEAKVKATDGEPEPHTPPQRQGTLDEDRIADLHPDEQLKEMDAEAGSRVPTKDL